MMSLRDMSTCATFSAQAAEKFHSNFQLKSVKVAIPLSVIDAFMLVRPQMMMNFSKQYKMEMKRT